MILRLREGFLEGSLPARDDVQQGVLEHHVLIMLGQAAFGNGARPPKVVMVPVGCGIAE